MHSSTKIIIAIDGYSSCGKSTLAKALAKKMGYIFVDSGAMYRGVTLYCMRNDLIKNGNPKVEEIEAKLNNMVLEFKFNPNTEKSDLYLNGENIEDLIRMPDVASNVSKIASIKSVREKLVAEQQKMGLKGGLIMDGRDIGSVVFPNAELKLFVTADPEIRAARRLKELLANGVETNFEDVFKNLIERDHLDSTRSESPLTKTSDAKVIDTSNLTPEGQLELAFNYSMEILKKQD
jgi:cytidylate kinase